MRVEIFFLVLVLIFLGVCTESFRVFLIGDSVDRYIVHDWCNVELPDKANEACPDCIQWYEHREHKSVALICQKGNDSIANIFLFGSNEEPPYYQTAGKMEAFHTKNLLPNATEVYFEKFGAPDLVVFQIMLWDIGYINDHFQVAFPSYNFSEVNIRHSSAWNASLTWYESNMRKRIHDLQTVVSKCTNHSSPINIALRSSVYNYVFGAKIHDMNIILKGLAKENGLSFFDYDEELWSIYDYQYHNPHYMYALTRDGFHPAFTHTVAAAEILLGLKHTRNMIYRGTLTPRYPACLFFTDLTAATSRNNTLPYTCSTHRLLSKEYVPIRAVSLLNPLHHATTLCAFANSSILITSFYTLSYPVNGARVVRRSQAFPVGMRKHLYIPPTEVLLLAQSVLDQIPFG